MIIINIEVKSKKYSFFVIYYYVVKYQIKTYMDIGKMLSQAGRHCALK